MTTKRFWSKVDPHGPLLSPYLGPCWLWTASVRRGGYGQFNTGNGSIAAAHRVAYEFVCGPVPEGLELDHLCRNRACVNPAHLEAVTRRTNHQRGRGPLIAAERERAKTHCPHGHPYDEKNTERRGGKRHCRACKRQRNRTRKRSTTT